MFPFCVCRFVNRHSDPRRFHTTSWFRSHYKTSRNHHSSTQSYILEERKPTTLIFAALWRPNLVECGVLSCAFPPCFFPIYLHPFLLSFTFSLLLTSSTYSFFSHSIVQTNKRRRSAADGTRGLLEPKAAVISSMLSLMLRLDDP